MAKNDNGVVLSPVGPELICEIRGVKQDTPTFTDPKSGRSTTKVRYEFAVEFGTLDGVKQAKLTHYPKEGAAVPEVQRGTRIVAAIGAWASVKGQSSGRIDGFSVIP